MGEKSHLLSRGTSLRLHPPVERKRVQRNSLHLLLGAQPRACPDLLGEGRGAPLWVGGHSDKENCGLSPKVPPQCGEKQIQGQGQDRGGWRKWAFESLEGSLNLLWKKLRKMPSTVTFTLTDTGRSSSRTKNAHTHTYVHLYTHAHTQRLQCSRAGWEGRCLHKTHFLSCGSRSQKVTVLRG